MAEHAELASEIDGEVKQIFERDEAKSVVASAAKEFYIDPEGGYADPEVGRQAELTAMTN